MKVKVEIKNPRVWYRKSTNEWVVSATFVSRDVCESINFVTRKKNKSKRKFYEFCCKGIIGEEMRSRFKNNEIHFIEQ